MSCLLKDAISKIRTKNAEAMVIILGGKAPECVLKALLSPNGIGPLGLAASTKKGADSNLSEIPCWVSSDLSAS